MNTKEKELQNVVEEVKASAKVLGNLTKKIKALQDEYAEIANETLSKMQYAKMQNCTDNGIALTAIKETLRIAIDTKTLKAELPDVAKKYEKISPVKACLKVAATTNPDKIVYEEEVKA